MCFVQLPFGFFGWRSTLALYQRPHIQLCNTCLGSLSGNWPSHHYRLWTNDCQRGCILSTTQTWQTLGPCSHRPALTDPHNLEKVMFWKLISQLSWIVLTILDTADGRIAFQTFLYVKSQQHNYFFSSHVPRPVATSLVLGRMQHIHHYDSTFALSKECKIHVLEIGSVGQTVY